ncbi:hypothetical protein Csa_010417, partial [Cucumis sativus]
MRMRRQSGENIKNKNKEKGFKICILFAYCVDPCGVALVLCFIEKFGKLGFESLGFGLLELGKEENKVLKVGLFHDSFLTLPPLWSTGKCFCSCCFLLFFLPNFQLDLCFFSFSFYFKL